MRFSDEMVEAGAKAAFWQDDLGGHVKGPWTWETIPEEGRMNYRAMMTAALEAVTDPDPNPFDDPRMWNICPDCCPMCHRHGGTFCHCKED